MLLIVLAVFPGGDALDPLALLAIPANRLLEPAAEIDLRSPAKFAFGFAEIDGVSQVVTGTVRDKLDQTFRLVEQLQQRVRQVDVSQFGVAAEVGLVLLIEPRVPRSPTWPCTGSLR